MAIRQNKDDEYLLKVTPVKAGSSKKENAHFYLHLLYFVKEWPNEYKERNSRGAPNK
jgi:hypothetical protein